jgi:disulfide bond formation protein DsbB
MNPNVPALVLMISFAIICALIIGNSTHDAPPVSTEEPVEVALVSPTETLQPSSIPLPPTPTMLPSNTVTMTASMSRDPALVAQGQQSFLLCSACHGPDARGIPNLGKDLVTSEFVAGLTDEELLQFIKMGRPIWDPLNTTGLDMPPKGGNPALTDEEILAIIAYLRSLPVTSEE